MARNMQKWIDEYYKQAQKDSSAAAAFTATEIMQMVDIEEQKAKQKRETPRGCVINAIFDSLAAGWIIGYRAGQRDAKRQQENGAGKRQKCPRTDESK